MEAKLTPRQERFRAKTRLWDSAAVASLETSLAVGSLKSWEKKPDFSGSRNSWEKREQSRQCLGNVVREVW